MDNGLPVDVVDMGQGSLPEFAFLKPRECGTGARHLLEEASRENWPFRAKCNGDAWRSWRRNRGGHRQPTASAPHLDPTP